MSISVLCDECGRTYQVRDEMAGRKGKCPRGHPIVVPELDEEPIEFETSASGEFDFQADAPSSMSTKKSGRRLDRRQAAEPEENEFPFSNPPAQAEEQAPPPQRKQPAAKKTKQSGSAQLPQDDFSAFSTPIGGSSFQEKDDEPPAKASRKDRAEPKAAARRGQQEGKPSFMPLILGGVLALLGVGGGITMLLVSRGEAGPLREKAEASNKKAQEAEEKAAKADALKVVAETELDKVKKNPPKDPALAEAQTKLKAAERRATEAERKLELAKKNSPGGATTEAEMPVKELDPTAPGGSADPVMPKGKLDPGKPKKEMDKKDPVGKAPADMPDGIPLGGKNWNAPGSMMLGMSTFKAGDRIWLWPQEDVTPKVEAGKMTIKFRWALRKGKELPEVLGVALMVQESAQILTQATRITLTGQGGDAEMTFDVKNHKGKLPIYFYVGNGQAGGPVAYSSMLAFTVDFGPAK
jgi:hypothetical protein